jgi:hypothetical protein
MAEKDKEEKKLGPSVTYLGNDDDDKQAVEAHGVRFKPGESVNLNDRLGEAKAAEVLKGLAGNRFFKVDGGPDHKAEEKKRQEAVQKEAEAALKDAEEANQTQAERDRKKQGYVPPENEQLESKPTRPVRER